MTSEGRARPREGEEAPGMPAATGPDDGSPRATDTGSPEEDAGTSGGGDLPRTRSRPSLPLVPTLLVLLVLLLAVVGYLWFTRPEESAVRTGDYAEALQAARSGVVDLTSFDHLTLDDDIEQVRRVTTGDLQEESVAQLEQRRAADHRPAGRRQHRGRRRRGHPRERRGRHRPADDPVDPEEHGQPAGTGRALPHRGRAGEGGRPLAALRDQGDGDAAVSDIPEDRTSDDRPRPTPRPRPGPRPAPPAPRRRPRPPRRTGCR